MIIRIVREKINIKPFTMNIIRDYYHYFSQYLDNSLKLKIVITYSTKKDLQSKINFISFLKIYLLIESLVNINFLGI